MKTIQPPIDWISLFTIPRQEKVQYVELHKRDDNSPAVATNTSLDIQSASKSGSLKDLFLVSSYLILGRIETQELLWGSSRRLSTN